MKLNSIEQLALYALAGSLVGWGLPKIMPEKYALFILFMLPMLGITQAFLFLAGLKWVMRQYERKEQGQPPESYPWYVEWNNWLSRKGHSENP